MLPIVQSAVAGPASADGILRRLAQLKTERSSIETFLRECYDHTYPLRGSSFYTAEGAGAQGSQTGQAAVRQAELLDSTGTESARILASALMSGLTPANSRWAESWVEGANEADRAWLDQKSTEVWQWIHRSNYDSAGFEATLDLVCGGQFYLFIDEAEEGGFTFDQWPVASTWAAASKKGKPLDTFYREVELTAEQAVGMYGENMVDKTVRDAAATDPGKTFKYCWAVYPRTGKHGRLARNMPWASCHVEVMTKRIVRESGYHECPIVAPRWQKIPNGECGVGPVFEALPSIKQLNTVIRLNLAGLEMNVAGMWVAKDDGVLNPHTVKVGPRKIIVAADTESIKPLIAATDMSKTILEIERLQRQIKAVMMADHLEPQTKPGEPETAYAVHVRVELIRQLLGPTYGRLQAEWLSPFWIRCWGIAFRSGTLGPAPESLREREFTVKYVSPLARAQRAVDLSAMDRYELALIQETQLDPNVLDNYNLDEAARMRAELGGVPSKLLRDRKEVERMRAQAAKDEQAQQQQGFNQEAMLEALKKGDGSGQAMAMAAMASAMNRPRNFVRKGREIVGIQ